MPNLLLEILSEEIPASLQLEAAAILETELVDHLKAAGVTCRTSQSYSGSRRLCVHLVDLPEMSPESVSERRGPRSNAPQRAVAGFSKSVGVEINELEIRQTGRGSYYFYSQRIPGQPVSDITAAMIEKILKGFTWPVSMRWGSARIRWVRPISSVLCILYGDQQSQLVEFEIGAIHSSNCTSGHKFMAPEQFSVQSMADYEKRLRKAFVLLDPSQRRGKIRSGAEQLAQQSGLTVVEDNELVDELVGLGEWPVPMLGPIESDFLQLPAEVLRVAMKKHQRYLSAADPSTGRITHFIAIADRTTKDDGKKILEGFRRVLSARLSDAKFFLDNDLRNLSERGLESGKKALAASSYHHKLGSQLDRVERIVALTRRIADELSFNPDESARAAEVAKIDLVSEIVVEFPELQGVMGRYFAERAGLAATVARAVEKHYHPRGPEDSVPDDPISISVGLADRINHLVGLFAIGENPTGSGDPHALRRTAMGMVRIILKNELDLPFVETIQFAIDLHLRNPELQSQINEKKSVVLFDEVLGFLQERLAAQLAEEGISSDVFDACSCVVPKGRFLILQERAKAVEQFLQGPEAEDLLSVYRRCDRILCGNDRSADEPDAKVDPALFASHVERRLAAAVSEAAERVAVALSEERILDAMAVMAKLAAPVHSYFDNVIVNAQDEELRINRHRQLACIVAMIRGIANFSLIRR